MTTQNKPIVSCTDVSKSFDTFTVLQHISLTIQQGEKIGLVGPNGAGKTTLLQLLAGLQIPDDGKVTLSKGISVGYIPQDFSMYAKLSVQEFLDQSEGDISKLQSHFTSLRLELSLLTRKISELSGGEKTKVALLRILLAHQDILLLDEPTNNLDIEALTFLEEYIKSSSKTFLIISHDREFLDTTVTRIFEIDEFSRELHIYDGNYSSYRTERTARLERAWTEYGDNVEKHEQLEATVEQKLGRAERMLHLEPRDNDKFLTNFKIEHGQRAFHQGAKLLKKRIENMEKVDKPEEPLSLHVEFMSSQRSGDKVYEVEQVTKKLPEHMLGPIDLTVMYGDRILITGPNGSGKSTFINLLLGKLKPDSGTITVGTNIHVGYLPQQEDILPDATVRDELLKHADIDEGMARRTLNRFKLSADDIDKKIGELSSGERSRLILAMLMAKDVNCLILDEPSNHLDFEVLESLEEALKKFKGTLLVVSHDRYLIERLGEMKKMEISK